MEGFDGDFMESQVIFILVIQIFHLSKEQTH